MKKFIQKFLSSKRNVAALVILLLIAASLGGYIVTGVMKNIAKMAVFSSEEASYSPPYPPTNTTGKNASLIQRGEYLVKAGDCMACHTNTPAKGKSFAGGLPMQTPFGVIYSPNITPDKETGIGKWSEADFIKAMHEGISPTGQYYFPAFPYLYFSQISTDDIKAIKAYLESIPAVQQPNRPNEMIWPFNLRIMQLPWRILFFHPKRATAEAPTQNVAQWQRGAYLVEGLGHCAMCHTPSYHILTESLPLGAPIHKYDLAGAKIQGYLAPNIGKANLEKIPVSEIVDVFVKDKMIGGGSVEGPMLEVNHDSLKYLSTQDLEAIATYLKTVVSQPLPKPKAGAGGAGKAIYETYCSGCHATGAGGAPKYSDATAWDPILKSGLPKAYANALNGIRGMPAKGTCISCSDEEIKQAVDYMAASVSGKKAGPVIPPVKKLTLADGQRIYNQNCSVCHATGFRNAPKPGDVSAWHPIVQKGFVNTYLNVVTGRNGHPVKGACPECSDAELKAAIKYMLQQSAPDKNYSLW